MNRDDVIVIGGGTPGEHCISALPKVFIRRLRNFSPPSCQTGFVEAVISGPTQPTWTELFNWLTLAFNKSDFRFR